MPFEITLDAEEDWVRLTPVGDVNVASILELGEEIRRRCADLGLNTVLLDCAGMTGALTVAELYSTTPKFVNTIGPSISVAYINMPSEWLPEDDQFSRNVAYNRGGSLEMFLTEDEALEWLRSRSHR